MASLEQGTHSVAAEDNTCSASPASMARRNCYDSEPIALHLLHTCIWYSRRISFSGCC